MIGKILAAYTAQLDEYLRRRHRQPEGVAELSIAGSASKHPDNKLVISLINFEREAISDNNYISRSQNGYTGKRPPLMLNLHIMMAAVYEDKNYKEALSVLSDTLTFIHSMPRFTVDKECYTVEQLPMSVTDIHNIWTTMGGQYHPSVICKVRGVALQPSGIISSGTFAGTTETISNLTGR